MPDTISRHLRKIQVIAQGQIYPFNTLVKTGSLIGQSPIHKMATAILIGSKTAVTKALNISRSNTIKTGAKTL